MFFSSKYKDSVPGNIPDTVYMRRGFFYLCMIMLLQTVFLLVLTLFVIALGITMSIPLWVYVLGLGLVISACVIFYKRYKSSIRSMANKLRDPVLQGKSVEISILRGLVSLRIGDYSSPSWKGLSYVEGELPEPNEKMNRHLITGGEGEAEKKLQ